MRLGRHLECGNSVCLPRSGSPGLALIRGPSYSRLAAREKQTASWSHNQLTLDIGSLEVRQPPLPAGMRLAGCSALLCSIQLACANTAHHSPYAHSWLLALLLCFEVVWTFYIMSPPPKVYTQMLWGDLLCVHGALAPSNLPFPLLFKTATFTDNPIAYYVVCVSLVFHQTRHK